MIVINEWCDIKRNFTDAILIGNGASVAINNSFNYSSLKEYAIQNGLFSREIEDLFEKFNTSDFEFILKLLWQTNNVNKALNIEDNETEKAYSLIRDLLIKIIQDIHPAYEEVQPQLQNISDFLMGFKTILSLNYDLILYWAIMYGNDRGNTHFFKDCFVDRRDGKLLFNSNWRKFRKALPPKEKTTLVFYLHGSLVFGTNLNNDEEKIISDNSSNLLDTILDKWRSNTLVPLFISEGTAEHKIAAIYKSHYLGTTYREVLLDSVWNISSLTIYGWSFGDSDLHILKRMFDYGNTFCRKIAVSVYIREGEDVQAKCYSIKSKILEIPSLRKTEIVFFNSASEQCWNN